ncbi:MAG: hypothetical protein GYB65_20625 [Chloroflexi bacterium]|nr:hypothetical protein [Chloroflexota bacterium]
MLTIHIEDEQLARRLRQIAERENRPVADVLRTLVEHYPGEVSAEQDNREASESVKQVRRAAYAKARRYWQAAGDTAKAALTDEALDEQFGRFDDEGIPRLKSELKSLEPPVGSLAYAAKIIREMGGIQTGGSLDATQVDEVLKNEFADYLLSRMRGEDGAE